ncbi:2-dehydro-3-deoxygalactonokinase [Aureimonas sp. SA4125]|uniref:2-dehydro-3-deoxygalactonokinase n=1 Tax=Aureimonas sp. SA4125 TaxID=2826993 RepID=UPI001CC5EEDE|nr:2-dehydro-3-deoxygalactonokinase [Aureimonas sp. SA4125]BDA84108.1 2-dehydro-3-deoxygalactonokinase [Aureimonas sp. SA4125]
MTTSDTRPFCAAVDWGTTSFRLWLLGRDGTVLGERRSRDGMQSAAKPGFQAVLEQHLSAVKAADDLPVIVCGMAGSRQGWVEAPYVDAPASFDAIAGGAIRVPDMARDVRILPGVAQRPGMAGGALAGDGLPFGPDVIRGEETQVMGLGLSPGSLLCLPGTHSKWISIGDQRIEAFSSFMTGELFQLLSTQSILRHTLDAEADVMAESASFIGGVEAGHGAPALILNRLFSMRAEGLFGSRSPAKALARLSGMLLGLEISGAAAIYPQRSVFLAASGPLFDLYRTALAATGWTVTVADADEAVRKGLMAGALQCFNPA